MGDPAKIRNLTTRRSVVTGMAAAPLARPTTADLAAQVPTQVQAWLADRDLVDRLTVRWGRLETILWRKSGGVVDPAAPAAAPYPEAQEMLSIDATLPALYARLEAAAQALAATPSRTLEDIAGKFQVLHRLTAPELDDPAASLLKGACEELRRMARGG